MSRTQDRMASVLPDRPVVHALLALGLSLAPASGQGLPAGETLTPEEIRAEPALISIDRKYASRSDIGLYLREPDGHMSRIWKGEPYDARALLDRTILVTDRWTGRIAWIDLSGKVLFERSGIDRPVDIEMAHDGTIVVVANGSNEILGLDPESGDIRWRRGGFRNPFDVDVLEDGGLLVADSGAGRIVELGPDGEVRFEVRGLGFPNTVERIEDANGRKSNLVTKWSSGEVLELDENGRVLWSVKVGGTVYRAERRLDGLTQICDGARGRILFVNRTGMVVKTERFQPGCVDYETIREL